MGGNPIFNLFVDHLYRTESDTFRRVISSGDNAESSRVCAFTDELVAAMSLSLALEPLEACWEDPFSFAFLISFT